MRPRRPRHRYDLVELFRQVRHLPVVIVSAAHVNQLRDLILDGGHYFRMAVSSRTYGDAGVAVEEDISVDVFDPYTAAAFSHQLERRSRIGRIHKLRIGLNNFAAFWSGQFGFDFRFSWCNCSSHHLSPPWKVGQRHFTKSVGIRRSDVDELPLIREEVRAVIESSVMPGLLLAH